MIEASETPNPRGFETIAAWLTATMRAQGERSVRAAAGIGITDVAVRNIASGKTPTPRRPTLDKIAVHYGVDPAELRAMRPKNASYVAMGKRIAAQRGPAAMCAMAEQGRAALTGKTPDERSAIARTTGIKAARERSQEWWADRRQASAESNRARAQRGWFANDEERAAWSDKPRRGGLAGGASTLQRHGQEHFQRISREVNEQRRNGEWRRCLFCDDPDRLVYRKRALLNRWDAIYHRACYVAWRQSQPMVDYSRGLGSVGWMVSRINSSGDEPLRARMRSQVAAQLADLSARARGRQRGGRPSTLLRDKELAVAIAFAHDDVGLPTRQIAEMAGFAVSEDARGHESQARHVFRLVSLGRALRGLPPA